MDFSTLGDKVKDPYLFKGSEKNPFLAPRGIFVSKGKLFVSDTGRNRVFIWNNIPTETFQEPDVILGQESIDETGRNAKSKVSSSTLQYPSGIWSDGKQLIVADAWNHRVLIWHEIPTKNAQEADVVLGQPNFSTNQPNVYGQASDPDANTLNWPYGVFSDGTHLWIADTGNRRVLFFNEIPKSNFSKADRVIGKPNFMTRDYENTDPIWPYSVKVNSKGMLAIADTQFYRTLIWNNNKEAFTQKADIIIGQENFEASGQNQFRLQPEANTLNWTYDACFHKEGILVNDTGNSRILGFDSIPSKNNATANWLIGRPNFNTSSEYAGNLSGTQSAIYWPFSITTYEDQLFIADTGNHRLVIAQLKS
ncbi:MAG: NHL repeat-containing protein [Bacteroidota bacterium]